jgi:translation initiation factor IF-2
MVWEGKLQGLRVVKSSVNQVGKGSECGIMFEGWTDFQVGDQIEL